MFVLILKQSIIQNKKPYILIYTVKSLLYKNDATALKFITKKEIKIELQSGKTVRQGILVSTAGI